MQTEEALNELARAPASGEIGLTVAALRNAIARIERFEEKLTEFEGALLRVETGARIERFEERLTEFEGALLQVESERTRLEMELPRTFSGLTLGERLERLERILVRLGGA